MFRQSARVGEGFFAHATPGGKKGKNRSVFPSSSLSAWLELNTT